jgi:hypothetical protein
LYGLFSENVPIRVECALKDEGRQEDEENASGIDLRDGHNGLTNDAKVCSKVSQSDTNHEESGCVWNESEFFL